MKLTKYDLIGRAKCSAIFLPEIQRDDGYQFRGQYRPINPYLTMARNNGIPRQTFYTRVHRGIDRLVAATMPVQSHSDVAHRQRREAMGGG